MKRAAVASRQKSKESYASLDSEGMIGSAFGGSAGNADGSSTPSKRGGAMMALAAAKKFQNQSSRSASHGSSTPTAQRAVRFSLHKIPMDLPSHAPPTGILQPGFHMQRGDTPNSQASSSSQVSEALAKLGNVFTLSDLVEAGVLSEQRAQQYAAEKVGHSAHSHSKRHEQPHEEAGMHVTIKHDRVLTIWDLSELVCRKDFCAWGAPEAKPDTKSPSPQESSRSSKRSSLRGSLPEGSLIKGADVADGGDSGSSSSSETSEGASDHERDEEGLQSLRKISIFKLPSAYRAKEDLSRGKALWKRGALKISVATSLSSLKQSSSSKEIATPSEDQSSPISRPSSSRPSSPHALNRRESGSVSPSLSSSYSPSSARKTMKQHGSPKRASMEEPGGKKHSARASIKLGKHLTLDMESMIGHASDMSGSSSPSPHGSPRRRVRPTPPPLAPAPPRGERPREHCPPLEGTWVPAACGGLGSERNPQVQMEAQRLTWVRMDLEVAGNCGPTIQMWVLGRSRWGLRRPKMANMIAKAESVGESVGPRQLRCEFELPPGEVSTTVVCCSRADESMSKDAEEAPTFKLFVTSTLPFARMPTLLLPRKPHEKPRRLTPPKQRLLKKTSQKFFGKKGTGPLQKKSPYRKGALCPMCGKAPNPDTQESGQSKSKSGPDGECACGCRRKRCLCWCWCDPPTVQAEQQASEGSRAASPQQAAKVSTETSPTRQTAKLGSDTSPTRQAAKANATAGIELFSANCVGVSENFDEKVCKRIQDICAGYSRNTQLYFNTEAKHYLLPNAKESDAAILGFAKRAALATGVQARNNRRIRNFLKGRR